MTIWVMGDSSAHFDELVAPFEEESGIDVKTVAVPWDGIDQKFTTAVASGDGPDVLQIGVSKLRNFGESGALMVLDDATISGYDNLATDNFIDGVSGDATAVGGKIISIPWVGDTRVLFYRSDILEEAGISEPPATWEELRADAKTLSDRGNDQYGYYIPQWDSGLPVIMTWSQGGDIVDPDGTIDFGTPAFAKTTELYAGFYDDQSVPTDADFDQTQGFTSGATPIVVSGPYLANAIREAAPELDGKWSAAPIPSDKDNVSLLAGSSLAVWGSTSHKESSLQLLNYLSDPETQLKWYDIDSQLPTVKAALEDDAITSDPLSAVYATQLMNARVLPMVPNWDGETGKAMLDALNSIVLNGQSQDEALAGLVATTSGTSVQ